MHTRSRTSVLVIAGLLGAAIIAPASVSATQPDPLHKVTICHRTNSVTNPYVVITVDEASVDGDDGNDNGQGDHLLEHLGAAFDFSADPDTAYPPPHNGDQWGDIIPPFYEDGVTPTGYPSLNWDAAGQDIFYAGCAAPTTTTTTETETTTTTETTDTETTTTQTTDTETTTTRTTSTGTEEEVTPPSTDTIGESSTGAVSGSLLLVLGGLLALALAVPAKARSRR